MRVLTHTNYPNQKLPMNEQIITLQSCQCPIVAHEEEGFWILHHEILNRNWGPERILGCHRV